MILSEYKVSHIIFFAIVVLAAILLDLFVHRKDKTISLWDAACWSCFWIFISLCFALYLSKTYGKDQGMLFLTGYFLEKSLSVDNLFAFIAVFSSFYIKDNLQHRVLYFGIIGAIVLRFIFITLGTAFLESLGSVAMALFGVLVLWSAVKMWQHSKKKGKVLEDYSNHWSVRLTKKIIPVHPMLEGHNFFIKKEGFWYATPLLLCLVAIEIADVLFAFDSIPAVFSIFNGLKYPLPLSTQFFLIFSSNLFAILGLRSLYFLLTAATRYLIHLEKSVIVILIFIGVKMLAGVFINLHISPEANLLIVFFLLLIGVLASFLFPVKRA